MRALWLIPAALISASEAVGQEGNGLWQAPAQWFEAAFPATPAITQTTYTAIGAQGQSIPVPATTYGVRQGGASYQVTVARLSGTPAQADHVLDYAISHVRGQRHLALDASTSHSYGDSGAQACGRQFGYVGKDGRLTYQTLFYNPRTALFYDIRSTVAAADQSEHGADVTHFQQSFALLADPAARPLKAPDAPGWQTVTGPDGKFTIRFPSTPAVSQTSYTTVAGVSVPATAYEARQGDTLYRVTAVHLWETAGDEPGALDREIARWQHRGVLQSDASVAVPAAQCGRDITLRDSDGESVHTTLFFPSSQHRIYILETRRKTPPGPGEALDDQRFRLSFGVAKPE